MPRHSWSFPVELPVRYRLGSDPELLSGVAHLLTDSEAYIYTARAPEPGAVVTIVVALTSGDHDYGGCVIGSGVIRAGTIRMQGTKGWSVPVFVIDIFSYRLARRDHAMRELEGYMSPGDVGVSASNPAEQRLH